MAAEDLQERVARLERELAERGRRIEKLERENERLRKIIDDLQRSAKRQAAPFGVDKPKVKPRRRGRKKGRRYGRRGCRSRPDRIDRRIHVGVPLWCTHCGKGRVKLHHRELQWQTDIPAVTSTSTEFQIDVGRCEECGRSVRDRHPEQISDATGAAGVQIGPRAIALAAKLNKECGMSYGRVAEFFAAAFGMQVSPSALAQALKRLARVMKPLYEQIGQQVRDAPMLSPDETGWRIGGHKAWLHAAATRDASFYLIARGRGKREAQTLIGKDYCGTIVRDGWAPYRHTFPQARSQTCLAHILRRINGLMVSHPRGRAYSWLNKCKRTLKRAIRIRDGRDEATLSPLGLVRGVRQIERAIDDLLASVPSAPLVRKLANHLCREHHALTTFLNYDAVPATNYLAEQALRPAVVNRKMSGGNNTETGARTQEILMTVAHTAKKRSRASVALYVDALRQPAHVTQLLPIAPTIR